MYTHTTDIRVRYAETDQMGYVYYGNYATFYEVARVEALRSAGFPYKRLEEMGIGMPVLEMETKYHWPARYDDLLSVKLTIPERPKARILFEYEILNQDQKLINTGKTTLLFINLSTGRPTRMPQELDDILKKYFP